MRLTPRHRPPRSAGARAGLLALVDQVYAIEGADVAHAKSIVSSRRPVSARDALHIAVMERAGVKRILSFDSDFDRYPGIERMGR